MAKLFVRTCLIVCLVPVLSFGNANNEYRKPERALPGDSIVYPASTRYGRMNFFKRMFLGMNYRKEWATPVKMEVFNIKKVKGGFTPGELGGGQQTKSLRMKDKDGKEWVLRTVDKDVTDAAVQPLFRKTFVKKMVQDMVSASHPYAPLSVKELAKAAGVIAPHPTLFYVPEDPALGEHYKLFANRVCMLEEREPTIDGSESEGSEKILEEISKENDHMILQKQVLRARLLDMLIADWDRHIDQWRWGKIDSAGGTYYYVIPRDRDFAFFNSNGLLTKFMSMTFLKHMRGFTAESKGLKKLNSKTWFFDQNFLNELDAETWKETITEFQQKMSDEVISHAVRQIPAEVYAISGAEIESKLKTRRDGLLKNGMKYYEYISASVHVMGTDKPDYFRVSKEGGDLAVAMYTYKGKDTGMLTYRRVFKRDETHTVFLEGFGEDDHFEIDNTVSSKIRLVINGGNGKDTFANGGKIREKMNDVEQNVTNSGALSKRKN